MRGGVVHEARIIIGEQSPKKCDIVLRKICERRSEHLYERRVVELSWNRQIELPMNVGASNRNAASAVGRRFFAVSDRSGSSRLGQSPKTASKGRFDCKIFIIY